MVPYGPLWSRVICMVPYCPVWSLMIPYDPLWYRIVFEILSSPIALSSPKRHQILADIESCAFLFALMLIFKELFWSALLWENLAEWISVL